MLARPTLCPTLYPMPLFHLHLVHMRLYIEQQFIIFTENVEKAGLFLSETSFHKLFNTNVVIWYKMYDIPRIGVAGYLPTARESCDGLRLQSEKFCQGCAGPWSTSWRHGPALKSLSNCRDLCAKLSLRKTEGKNVIDSGNAYVMQWFWFRAFEHHLRRNERDGVDPDSTVLTTAFERMKEKFYEKFYSADCIEIWTLHSPNEQIITFM